MVPGWGRTMFCMYVNTYIEDMHTTIIQKQIYEKRIFPPTFLTSVGSNYSSVGIRTYGLHEALRKKKNIPNLSSMNFWGASLKTWILWYATLESYSILRKNGHTSKTSSWFTMLHRAVTYGPLPGWDTFLTSLWFSFRWAKSAKHLHFDALGNDLLLGAISFCIFLVHILHFQPLLTI